MTRDAGAIVAQISSSRVREDATRLLQLMEEASGAKPHVTARGVIGFGTYHYRYASGREGDFFKIGFDPKDDHITIYVMSGLRGFDDILERLGKHRASKSTVKIRRLSEIDEAALRELVSECVKHLDEVEAELGAIPRMSEIPPRAIS
jgi:hypothetical protein